MPFVPRRRKSRIYARDQGAKVRYYGDFRDYRDVGGAREALVPDGCRYATTDPDIAEKLAEERLDELRTRRKNKALYGIEDDTELGEYVRYHVKLKEKTGKVTKRWARESGHRLDRAVRHFGEHRHLHTIHVRHVQDYVNALRDEPNGRGGTLSGGTIRHYLNALSHLYRRAESEGLVPQGYNPVASLMDKPEAGAGEADWMEVHEAALFLEACRIHKWPTKHDRVPIYELVAALLLTGGRQAEVFGLAVGDVSLERETVTIRPNDYRRVKTVDSRRTIPLWPQLAEILEPLVAGRDPGELVFVSPRTEDMITDIRRPLDRVATRAGFGHVRSKMFRHTYCSARLQTLDGGQPVAKRTVEGEMGHGSGELVQRIYGHLGTVRHRSRVVEYRVGQHFDALEDRLVDLRDRNARKVEA